LFKGIKNSMFRTVQGLRLLLSGEIQDLIFGSFTQREYKGTTQSSRRVVPVPGDNHFSFCALCAPPLRALRETTESTAVSRKGNTKEKRKVREGLFLFQVITTIPFAPFAPFLCVLCVKRPNLQLVNAKGKQS
jgi:hypothetical protein